MTTPGEFYPHWVTDDIRENFPDVAWRGKLEAEAQSIRTYSPHIVPSLLRTRGYDEYLQRENHRQPTDAHWHALHTRQEAFWNNPRRAKLRVVLGQEVLGRLYNLPIARVRQEQAAHLLEISTLKNVSLRELDDDPTMRPPLRSMELTEYHMPEHSVIFNGVVWDTRKHQSQAAAAQLFMDATVHASQFAHKQALRNKLAQWTGDL